MVKQKLKQDCFFCCVAQAAGLTYKQLQDRVGWAFMVKMADGGVGGIEDATFVLDKSGLKGRYKRLWTAPGYVSVYYTRNLLWGRKAILQVPCTGGVTHAVYWDGEHLHDPGKGTGWKMEQLMGIENVFLLKEGV